MIKHSYIDLYKINHDYNLTSGKSYIFSLPIFSEIYLSDTLKGKKVSLKF